MSDYQTYTCSQCGAEARNTYSEPYKTEMLERKLCWSCNFYVDFERDNVAKANTLTIIEGHVYTPGNRTTGNYRGMAGRRFDIEYIEPSIHAGKRITTFDLWSGSTLPDHLRTKFPDTAKFLNGAEKVSLPYKDMTTCWNPSQTPNEPFPLPRTLGIGQ